MSQTIKVSSHLAIELLSGSDGTNPALRLFLRNDPDQSFIVFLSEIHLLRDALAKAGTHLSQLEKEAKSRKNQAMTISSNWNSC